MSAGRGAYWGWICMTALVSPVLVSSDTATTFPTLTPEIRTSDCGPSSTASLNSATIR